MLKWIANLKATAFSGKFEDLKNKPEMPLAGSPDEVIDNYQDYLSTNKSGFYTIVNDEGIWHEFISLRHRNGNQDGTDYGMCLYTKMTGSNDSVTDLIWTRQLNEVWGSDKTILDDNNYKRLAFNIEHNNEINIVGNLNDRTTDYIWVNYRDKITDGGTSKPISKYVFGDGSCTAKMADIEGKSIFSNERAKLHRGSYVSEQVGTSGSSGYVNFARIKVLTSYANYPCVFVLGGRGRPIPMFVCVDFTSYNGTDPTLAGFYKLLCDSYEVYICKTATSQWDLYAPKNEAYGRVDILDMWYSSGHFQITLPNTHVAASANGWSNASMRGNVQSSNYIKDKYNNVPSYLSYSTTGLSPANAQWLAMWHSHDGIYELKAVDRNNFMQTKYLNGYYGMAVNNYVDNQWIRTTSQGLIPYQSGGRGSGHCQLGTDSWYFLKSFIDQMFGVTLDLSGAITSRVNTSTHINGAKGISVGINMLNAGTGYTILATLKSTNGVFCIGQYQKAVRVYFISNSLINANTNSVNQTLKLLDENGDTEFPGTVIVNVLNSRGSISGGNATFNTVTTNSETIKGNLRLQNGNYNQKINFGDGDYAYVHEDSDDHLKIYGSKGIKIKGGNNEWDFYSTYITLKASSENALQISYLEDPNSVTISPWGDNKGRLGDSTNRWKQVWAVNGSIQTSDVREKKEISRIGDETSEYEDTRMSDDTLIAFIMGLEPVIFKRIDGESGRPHHGFISQDFKKLLDKLGIKDHAAFIKAPKEERVYYEVEEEREVKDEDGNITIRKVKSIESKMRIIPGEFAYGMRYEEILSDSVRFDQILYNRINEQQELIDKQNIKINELEERVQTLEKLVEKILISD